MLVAYEICRGPKNQYGKIPGVSPMLGPGSFPARVAHFPLRSRKCQDRLHRRPALPNRHDQKNRYNR